jgi:hypothetical protein
MGGLAGSPSFRARHLPTRHLKGSEIIVPIPWRRALYHPAVLLSVGYFVLRLVLRIDPDVTRPSATLRSSSFAISSRS